MAGVFETLIWAIVVAVIVLPTLLFLARPVRRALEAFANEHTASREEIDARTSELLLSIDERRHELAIRQGTLGEEVETAHAKLLAETEQYGIDAQAAKLTLEEAVDERKKVLAARGQIERELLPELLRDQYSGQGGQSASEQLSALGSAYKAYCDSHPYTPDTFIEWIGDFRGISA